MKKTFIMSLCILLSCASFDDLLRKVKEVEATTVPPPDAKDIAMEDDTELKDNSLGKDSEK